MDMNWKPMPTYDQCMDCDQMMSGPETGKVPALGQVNWAEYPDEGEPVYEQRTETGATFNISHKLCKNCAEKRNAWVENRRREIAEQREREEREKREAARKKRRFRRGRKDSASE